MALIAHELRNPIHSVPAFAELLVDDDEAGSVSGWRRMAVDGIQHAGRRMERLASDLLLLRQLESAHRPVDLVSIDVSQVVAASLAAAAPVASAKHVTLAVQGNADEAVVAADAFRLGQALDNLIGNAIKFTPAGGTVTLTLRRESEVTQIAIADTVPGIPAIDVPHLFLPFYRVEAARRAGAPGAGLGLSIARAIVNRHGIIAG